MPNLNKILLMGNLTQDPELRVTPKGSTVCQFGLAMNREWKDDAGQKQQETLFVDVTAFGRTGETIAKYCTKGRPLYVEGRLKLDTWDDKTTGQKRSKHGVICESFQFLGGRDSSSEGSQPDAPDDADQTRTHRAPPRGGRPAPAPQHDIDDSDVPF